jgi:hypothetical protein
LPWHLPLERTKRTQTGLEFSGKHELLVYADVNLLQNVPIISKIIEASLLRMVVKQKVKAVPFHSMKA